MSGDKETLNFYDNSVEDYAQMMAAHVPHGLTELIDALPPGARVLDLGCGTGECANRMAQAGMLVDAVDGSAEMVRHVRETHGIDARQMYFQDLNASDEYDAVWASFSLLHADRADFPDILSHVYTALHPGGKFVLSMKLGAGEHRDSLGRYYAYYSLDELEGHLHDAGFTVENLHFGAAKGLAGTTEEYVVIAAHA